MKQTTEDPAKVDKFIASFYNGLLKGDSRSVAVSTFVDLMHREQAFNKTGISEIKKMVKDKHIRAIESNEVLAKLMDISEGLVDPELAGLPTNLPVEVDQGGLAVSLPTAHNREGAHWFGQKFLAVRACRPEVKLK